MKGLAYWLTGSVGLLSDAVESLVNLVGAFVALAMLTVAARPADEDHLYGHSKAEYFASGVEGTLIDLRAGDDEFHGDPEFTFKGVPSEWGIDPGDLEQRALIGALEIDGGDGNDRLWGGALDDVIDGVAHDVGVGVSGTDRVDRDARLGRFERERTRHTDDAML